MKIHNVIENCKEIWWLDIVLMDTIIYILGLCFLIVRLYQNMKSSLEEVFLLEKM